MERQELVRSIENAFPLFPLPKTLAGERTACYDEYSYVEEFFTDRTWNGFSMKELWDVYVGDQSAIPSFMSDEALVYYLPGFLLVAINDYEEADLLVDSIINRLTLNGNCRLNRLGPRFNRQQANAIARFLTYIAEAHPGDFDRSRLDKAVQYWSRLR